MAPWVWLVIVGAVVVAAALGAVAVSARRRQQRKTAALRERFGSEYDRTVESAGGRREAEAELEQRLRRREELDIAPHPRSATASYESEWRDVESSFEDTPLPALARADALVTTVLADRGYPMDSFTQRAADLSVDYPDAVEHYRRAHTTYRQADDGKASDADLYEALQHYRALLDGLAARPGSGPHSEPAPADGSRPQRPPSDQPPATT